MIGFGRDFTKTVVTLAQEGVRGSSWALGHPEFYGESISDTPRAFPRDLGTPILKKHFFRYFPTFFNLREISGNDNPTTVVQV